MVGIVLQPLTDFTVGKVPNRNLIQLVFDKDCPVELNPRK